MRIETKSMRKRYIVNFFQNNLNNSKYKNFISIMKKIKRYPR